MHGVTHTSLSHVVARNGMDKTKRQSRMADDDDEEAKATPMEK